MSGTAILCSGQGYQGADMFDLLADAPASAPVFEAAKFVLDGKDPRQLVREAIRQDRGGQVRRRQTANKQIHSLRRPR